MSSTTLHIWVVTATFVKQYDQIGVLITDGKILAKLGVHLSLRDLKTRRHVRSDLGWSIFWIVYIGHHNICMSVRDGSVIDFIVCHNPNQHIVSQWQSKCDILTVFFYVESVFYINWWWSPSWLIVNGLIPAV